MEKKNVKAQEANSSCCSSGCCSGGSCHGHHVVRIICKVVTVLIVLGLICGMARFAMFEHGGKFCGATNAPVQQMMKYHNGGCDGWLGGDRDEKTTKLFGTITKVEGNKITLTDNAAKEQVVYTQSNTTITNTTTLIGLTGLKAGQNVLYTGATDPAKAGKFIVTLMAVL